jgi:hypothetical protein
MQHPGNATRDFTRFTPLPHLLYNQLLNQYLFNHTPMTSNRELRLQQALQDLQTHKYPSIRAAAAANEVDHTTLSRRLKGQVSRSLARESQQLLSNQQEMLLKQWILDLEAQGHAATYTTIRELAAIISLNSGGPEKIGHNWITRFLQRHPDIHSKVGKKIQAQRLDATTPQAITAWFTQLEGVRKQYKIQWRNTYNMDETGIALGVCNNQRVIGTTSTTSSFKKTPENREWVSIIETISAEGIRLQALIIFKGQTLQTTWFTSETTPDYQYTASMNGWTCNEIGLAWLDQIFLPQTVVDQEGQYRLLLVDGHKSHATWEFMWKCHENRVIVFYLLPHSSHVLQPLDLACFSLLKGRYRDQITNLARFDDSSAIKKAQFLEYYHKAAQEGLNHRQIVAGWKAAGIHPWDPRKVIRSRLIIQSHQTTQQTPQTPPSRKRTASISNLYYTPLHNRDYRDTCSMIIRENLVSRPIRGFLQKVSKTIDQLEWESIQKDLQLKAQQAQIDDLNKRKKKRQTIDCNETFANIETIHMAKQAIAALPPTRTTTRRLTTPENTRNTIVNDPQSAYMNVFSIHPMVVDN